MKRHLLTAALAVGLLGWYGPPVLAHGTKTYGVNLGISFSFYCDKTPGCGPDGCCHPYGCLYPPGFSPCYPCPTMYGGLAQALAAGNQPYVAAWFNWPCYLGALPGHDPGTHVAPPAWWYLHPAYLAPQSMSKASAPPAKKEPGQIPKEIESTPSKSKEGK